MDAKLKSFAERLLRVRDDAKADIETIMEQAEGQDIDKPGLRRLAAWMGKDEKKRAEQEAIDDQMRFLAGLLPKPAELPADGQIATAAALFADKLTIREVAASMKISVGKAHQLKTLAAMFTVHQKMNVNACEKIGHNSRRPIAPDFTFANAIAEQERREREEAKAKRDARRAELAAMLKPTTDAEWDSVAADLPPYLDARRREAQP